MPQRKTQTCLPASSNRGEPAGRNFKEQRVHTFATSFLSAGSFNESYVRVFS